MKEGKSHKLLLFSDFFDKRISGHDSVHHVFAEAMEGCPGSITLSFKDIEFISRSAAHQVLIEKEKIEEKEILVKFYARNFQVKQMLEVVMSPPAKQHKPSKYFEVLTFENEGDFEQYLSEI